MKTVIRYVIDNFGYFFLLGRGEIRDFIFPGRHAPLFARRRSRFILSRVRMVSAVFAILTPMWIVVDWIGFPRDVAWIMSGARVLASLIFLFLAAMCRCTPTPRHSRIAIGLLFAIPTIFFLFSRWLLTDAHLNAVSSAMVAGYTFLPFVLVGGLSIFPLAALETLAFSLPILLLFTVSMLFSHSSLLPGFSDFAIVWLIALLAVVSSMASMSQLQLMKDLYQESSTDSLTGLLNRRSGEALLAILYAQSVRHQQKLTVAFLDLDNFKLVNDRYRHEAGDYLLGRVGEMLGHALRSGDAIIRWGGEEFLVVMPQISLWQAESRILTILRAHGLTLLRQDGKPVTFSIGMAERSDSNAQSWEQLVHLADERMYRSKKTGKNRITVAETAHPMAVQNVEILHAVSENDTQGEG